MHCISPEVATIASWSLRRRTRRTCGLYCIVVGADTTYRFWRKADWVRNDVEQVFRLNELTGHVVVRQAGVYLIYAQVINTTSLHLVIVIDCSR